MERRAAVTIATTKTWHLMTVVAWQLVTITAAKQAYPLVIIVATNACQLETVARTEACQFVAIVPNVRQWLPHVATTLNVSGTSRTQRAMSRHSNLPRADSTHELVSSLPRCRLCKLRRKKQRILPLVGGFLWMFPRRRMCGGGTGRAGGGREEVIWRGGKKHACASLL